MQYAMIVLHWSCGSGVPCMWATHGNLGTWRYQRVLPRWRPVQTSNLSFFVFSTMSGRRIKTPALSAPLLKQAGRKRKIPMKRVERETSMTLKHKLQKSTSATSLALTDALNKLQELELQATENRFKVNRVHESVEKTLSEYGKYRVIHIDLKCHIAWQNRISAGAECASAN